MKSQAFSDPTRAQFLLARKTMEINPRHPIIVELNTRAAADPEAESEDTKDLARLLYDTALLNSGFAIDDAKEFAGRMYRLMRAGLKLESLELLPEIEVAPEVSFLRAHVTVQCSSASRSLTCVGCACVLVVVCLECAGRSGGGGGRGGGRSRCGSRRGGRVGR